MTLHKIIEIIENNHEIYELLKYCPYEILRHLEMCVHPKGSVVFNQGEVYDYLYILVDGLVDIYKLAENTRDFRHEMNRLRTRRVF
ncbi:cyclic nucleotide-binding domain-containing protein [Aneurinibacillus terranovensis]|uniref:cyclic nucleotide-binding domain-containing protein n=1 Tax=Aneurinibacillus terranovensis TaxID=278991 RepID=UPI0003FA7373